LLIELIDYDYLHTYFGIHSWTILVFRRKNKEKRVYMGLMPGTGVSGDIIYPACQTLIEGLNYEKRLLVLMRIVDL
jgi:hypothetical protein